jgi:hypothetical protein
LIPGGYRCDVKSGYAACSDIGGSYLRGGLGVRSLNLMTDYHNGLLSEPLLPRMHEPTDARMNVLHQSEQVNALFRIAPKMDCTADRRRCVTARSRRQSFRKQRYLPAAPSPRAVARLRDCTTAIRSRTSSLSNATFAEGKADE